MNEEIEAVEMTSHDRSLSGYHIVSDPGLLLVSGPDRIDFLQRQTTNDLRSLSEHDHLITVATTPTARILDVLTVFEIDEDRLGVLTLPGRGAGTTSFLKSRIFFQDNVRVEDVSDSIAIIESFDRESIDRLTSSEQVAALISGHAPIARTILTMHNEYAIQRVVVPTEVADRLIQLITDFGMSQLSDDAFEVKRIERGMPGPNELTEDYTPLETDLRYAVADAKGCYTGQEVIARQITYNKVTRGLTGFRLSSDAPVGSRISYENRSMGTLTSVAKSPVFGWIGLGVVSAKNKVTGTTMSIMADSGPIEAVVADLPFVD